MNMARPKKDPKDLKLNTAFRLTQERIDQLDEIVIYYIEETEIEAITRTTIIDKMIKEKHKQLMNENKL